MNTKLTAEGIMSEAMRMGAKLSDGEFSITIFPHKIQRIIRIVEDRRKEAEWRGRTI